MSFDLGVWYSSTSMTVEDAAARYVALCEREPDDEIALESFIEANERVGHFLMELNARYVSPSKASDEQFEEGPWSSDHDMSEGHVIMAVRWSRADEIGPVVFELAQKHGLVLYDPQANQVYLPPALSQPYSVGR